MFERAAAASLEPCHFQRVLPPKTTSFKSTRRLHTAFWQHGALDIELSNVWQLLIREPLDSLNLFPTSHGTRNDSTSASFFLLDFLYPQGAASLLRKLSPSVLRYERPRLYLRGAVPRLFTSSACSAEKSRDTKDDTAATTAAENVPAQEGSVALVSDDTVAPAAIDNIPERNGALTSDGTVATAEDTPAPAGNSALISDDTVAPTATENVPIQQGNATRDQDASEGSSGETPTFKSTASAEIKGVLESGTGMEELATNEKGIATSEDPVLEDMAEVDAHPGDVTVQDGTVDQKGASLKASLSTVTRILRLEPIQLRTELRTCTGEDLDSIWVKFHAQKQPEEVRSEFMDFITKHRSLSYLLAKSLKNGNWQTLCLLWARHPDFHKNPKPIKTSEIARGGLICAGTIDWETFDRCISSDGGLAANPTHEVKGKGWVLMEGISSIIKQMSKSAEAPPLVADPKFAETFIKHFINPVVFRYHGILPLEEYADLPGLAKDATLYELYLHRFVKDPELRRVSDTLYREVRKLPNVVMSTYIMSNMGIGVYNAINDAEGMEMVLEDFHQAHKRMSPALYRTYIWFFGRRGDVKSTQRMFDEYRLHYGAQRQFPKAEDERRYPDFFPLLYQYAARGELTEARRIFTQAQVDFGPTLDARCWNALLNAHAVANDYDGGIRVFGVLKQAVTANHYSYTHMMSMAGIRGDLEFTLELYRMAKSEGVTPNVWMVDCVVEAYCQNDRFNDAESIVKITTEKERFSKSDLTMLWNSLLYHYAARRDLIAVNEALNTMTEHSLPYDAQTYSHLLRALAWAQLPHQALLLMQQATQKRAFKPTLEHYSLLMSSFMWNGQPKELFRTSTILRNLGMPQSGEVLIRVLRALSTMATKLQHQEKEKARKYLVSMLRQFRESIELAQNSKDHLPRRKPKRDPWIDDTYEPVTVLQRTEQTNILIHTFSLMRMGTDVKDIMKLWAASSPEASSMQEPPTRLLHSLMHVAFYNHNLGEVRTLWQKIFDRTVQKSRAAGPGATRDKALPSMRYALNDPLKTIQRLHGVTEDPDGLRKTVMSVLHAGFKLDSKNWNFYVQLLAGLKRWREAFIVCEEHLMPQWRGWARVRARTAKAAGVSGTIPIMERRKGSSPLYVRPTAHTLLVLSKAYMDLEQMTAWSGEAERLQRYIETQCPAIISAVKSAIRTNSPLERSILEHGKPKDSRDRTYEEMAAEKPFKKRPKVVMDNRFYRELTDDGMPATFMDMSMLDQKVDENLDGIDTQVRQSDWEAEAAGQTGGQGATTTTTTTAATNGSAGEDSEMEDWEDVAEEESAGENGVPDGPHQDSAISGDKEQDAEEDELRLASEKFSEAEVRDDVRFASQLDSFKARLQREAERTRSDSEEVAGGGDGEEKGDDAK